MIYLEMYGRLGNQLFRYAAARCLQLEYYPTEKIVINFNQINELAKEDPSFCNNLKDYNVSSYEIYDRKGKVIANEASLAQKIVAFFYYIGLKKYKPIQMSEEYEYEYRWQKRLNGVGLYWFRIGYCKLEKADVKNKILSGSFEAPQYFEKYKETIKKEFTPKYPRLDKNADLYNLIENTESICVSIRRGDFESNKDFKSVHSLCDKEYFLKSIEVMKNTIEERGCKPVFVLFSDDITWVKENICITSECYYEDGTDPVWEKLRMMSVCKHFVLSNSTFSWWAQYLSNNDSKVVISPSRWFNNNYLSPLIDDKWIKIEV